MSTHLSITPSEGNPATPVHGSALKTVGTLVAALALVILAASVLLRLATRWDAAGLPVSTLPHDLEAAVRLIHRVAASTVTVLAMAAAWMVWCGRRRQGHAPGRTAQLWMPAAAIAGATVLLAVIGPLTPGYRYASVTITNVVAGTVLLMSAWWLRETIVQGGKSMAAGIGWVLATTVAFLTHIGTGAAASAWEMQDAHWVAYVHMASAMVFFLAAGEILWVRPTGHTLGRLERYVTALLVSQIAMGIALMWLGRGSLVLGVVHAVVSQLVAAGLVMVAVRRLPLAPALRI